MEQVSSREETRYMYDYVVNIFKAHGLSIIAALSAEVPGIPFSPFDADSIKDVLAARKAENLGKVIMRANRSKLLFYHALFTLFTNHFVASYTYYERNKKYGKIQVPKYKTITNDGKITFDCPECLSSSELEQDKCPSCGGDLEKNVGDETQETVQEGMEEINRGMQLIKVRGTLNVKLPVWAADQPACTYLIDYYDQHYGQLRRLYPEIRDQINNDATDNFERIARMPSIGRLYADTYLSKLQTLKRVWIREDCIETLDKVEADEIKNFFKLEDGDGVYFACINENLFAEAENACLDDDWTIAKGDLSRAVHGDPLGKPLLPMQDLENTVSNLLIESLEHSVPSTFADPDIIDFETYSKQEVLPGAIYPAKNPAGSGKKLDDYFYTLKTATLPKEGVDFDTIVQNKGQFVVGAFPSIFGGPQTEGSKTLGEYQESRNYALQRLSIPYQMLFFWWADTIHKSVKGYISNMVNDETHTMPGNDGKYISLKLLQEDFQAGRFDQILPESATDLPVSFSQKRSNIQQMIQLNSDRINEFLFSNENRRVTLRYLGIEEFSDLDSNQTTKQLCELDDLIKGDPVEIEPEIDEHEVHLRIIRNFLSSEYGQELKKLAPDAYERVMEHAKAHYQFLMQSMQMQNEKEANKTLLKNTKVRTQKVPVSQVEQQIQQQTHPAPVNGGGNGNGGQ